MASVFFESIAVLVVIGIPVTLKFYRRYWQTSLFKCPKGVIYAGITN